MELLSGISNLWTSKAKLAEPVVRKYSFFGELPYLIHRPSIQRELIAESVIAMREHIQIMYKEGYSPVFGVIDVCILEGLAYVVDGQHRLKALEEEWVTSKIPIPFYIMEYKVTDKTQLEFVFVTRNKGVAVPSFMLNDEIGAKKQELLREIAKRLATRPLFVHQNGSGGYRPRVNIGEFMTLLTNSKLFAIIWDKHSDKDNKDIADYWDKILNNANIKLAEKATDASWIARHKISDNMLRTCVSYKSYFGLTMDRFYFEDFYIPREHATLPT